MAKPKRILFIDDIEIQRHSIKGQLEAIVDEKTNEPLYEVITSEHPEEALNKYAFEYRIFVLVAVIYLLYAHYTGC